MAAISLYILNFAKISKLHVSHSNIFVYDILLFNTPLSKLALPSIPLPTPFLSSQPSVFPLHNRPTNLPSAQNNTPAKPPTPDYRAGAHIAITSSYQASIPGLTKHLPLSPAQAHKIVQSTVELAIRARSDYLSSLTDAKEKHRKSERLLIAGSVGPYGAFLADGSEYRGDYTLSKDEFKDWYVASLVPSKPRVSSPAL
jgi:hypothetical protein